MTYIDNITGRFSYFSLRASHGFLMTVMVQIFNLLIELAFLINTKNPLDYQRQIIKSDLKTAD